MAIKYRAGHDTWTPVYGGPAVPRPTYDGAVLAVGGFKYVRVMSDVWGTETFATVWDGAKILELATSLSDDMGNRTYADADVDATPDVLSAVRAYKIGIEAARLKAAWDSATDKALDYAANIAKGKDVVVARGRKVPKGTTGEVFWLGHGKFGLRAGVKDAAGNVHWTAASNLDVIDPWDYLPEIPVPPTAADLTARATANIDHEAATVAARKAA